ncbi:MAG: NAD(P)-dependent oxidoreductase, partial [Geminicoccales bacterium]
MIGCIGLGVMGEPICANLLRRSGCRVVGFDLRPEPLARLADAGLAPQTSAEEVARRAQVVFLSLPGGPELAEICARLEGAMGQGALLVDLSTAPVDLTRALAQKFAARGIAYADAPVARTRFAAERGELSVMVGADAATFARILPYLRCFASDVLHCGPIGAGQ